MRERERVVEPGEPHDALGFERLVATLSATFIGLPADAIVAHIEHALQKIR